MKNHNNDDDDEIKLSARGDGNNEVQWIKNKITSVIKLNVINARVKIITFIGSTHTNCQSTAWFTHFFMSNHFSDVLGYFFYQTTATHPHSSPFIPQNLTSTHSDDDDGEYKLTFTPFAAFVLSP